MNIQPPTLSNWVRRGGRVILRYAGALLAVGAGWLLRWALTKLTGGEPPAFLTFYPAILFTALLAGFGPGLLATAVATLLCWCWVFSPRGSFEIAKLSDAVTLAVFAGMGVLLSTVAEVYRSAKAEAASFKTRPAASEVPELPPPPGGQNVVISAGMALSLILMIGAGLVCGRYLTGLAQADQLTIRSHLLIQELEQLLSSLKDVQTGQRGFLLTGEESYLEPYTSGVSGAARHLAALEDFSVNNTNRQQRLASLRPLIQEELAICRQFIELRRTKGMAAAVAVEDRGQGKLVMDQIRSLVAAGQAEERKLLQTRQANKELQTNKTIRALLAGGGFSLLLVATIFVFLRQENLRRTRVEAELSRHRDQLEELVAELEHFSYSIIHNMRAPLRAMQGFAELLEETTSTGREPDAQQYLSRIKNAAARMDLLITDALVYNRAVRQELALTPVDTGALLREMLDSYPEFQPSKAHIEIAASIPWVMGNQAGLTQCFSNLLANAVKFAKPGQMPQIRVWAEAADGWVRLCVDDRGIGIPPTMLPRIFDMFSRGHQDYAGTGIGLALVRKVMDRMGGKVTVESEEGKGSRFWLSLRSVAER